MPSATVGIRISEAISNQFIAPGHFTTGVGLCQSVAYTVDVNYAFEIVAKDVMGSWMQRAISEELEEAKVAGKMDLIVKGYLGDAQALYQIGALRREGRLGSELKEHNRLEVMTRLEAAYEKKYFAEMAKPEGERDERLVDFYGGYQIQISQLHNLA